ncbi:2Fe-2S iron-sulfur cluster-binding protein [Streptomyces sp. URMC 124]|uniref:(2Fe-2S)-binding protein n=1 Tax=Streptomyces sp. URMC 124 TaxID=3423405 RepID=UPI003F1D98FF
MSDEQRQAHAAGPVGWEPIPRGGEYDEGTTFLQLPPELLAHPGAATSGTGTWDPLAAAGSGGYTPPSADSWQQAPAAAAAAGAQGQWGTYGHGEAGGQQGGYQPGPEAHAGAHDAHSGVHDAHSGVHDAAYGETYGEGVQGVHGGDVHGGDVHGGDLHSGGLHDADPHATAEWPAPGAGSTGQWSVPAAGDDPVDESGEYLVRGAAPEAPAAPVTPSAPWSAQPVDDSWRQSLAAATPAAGTPVPGVDTGQWSVPVLPEDAPVTADASGEYALDGFPGAAAEHSASHLPGEPPAAPGVDATSTFTVPAYVSDVTGTGDNPGAGGTAYEHDHDHVLEREPSAADDAAGPEEPQSAPEPEQEPEPGQHPGQHLQPTVPPQQAVHAESFGHAGPAEQHGRPTLPEHFVPQQGGPSDATDAVAPDAGAPDHVASDHVAPDVAADHVAPEAAPSEAPEHRQDEPAGGTEAAPEHGVPGVPGVPDMQNMQDMPDHGIPSPGVPAHDTLGGSDTLGSSDALAATDPLGLSDPLGTGVPHNEHPCTSYVLRVNGTDRPVTDAWIGESLLYVLRERLGLAGAKDGCSQGECGACSVQVDGRLVASCLVPAATTAGAEVRTVEGLAVDGRPSDVQRALAECGAVQCGFCVPGMAMTMHDLLEGNHAPTERETRQAICGNLCRCSGYRGVLDAVRQVVGEREAAAAQEQELQDAQGQGQAQGQAYEGQAYEGQAYEGQPDADQARIPHQAGPHGGGSGKATTA